MIDMVAAKLTVYVLALLPAEDLTNPAPKAPTAGTAAQINDLMGWGKWMAMVAGFAGLVIAGIMMAVCRRSRSQMAADGAIGIPWVIGGLSVVLLSVPLVNQIL